MKTVMKNGRGGGFHGGDRNRYKVQNLKKGINKRRHNRKLRD